MIGAIIVTIKVESSAAKYWLSMLGNTFSGVGLAVLIAGVFNFIIGTRDFLNYIRDRLVEIVLSKEFVTRLSEDDQKKLLKITMKPSREISSIYSGIDDCFDGYVSQSMALFDSSYRGQMYISAVASFDKDRNTTRIDWDLNYVVYRVAGKFEPMPFWFGNEKSIHVKTTITADKNDIEVLTEKDLKGAENKDPSMAIGFTVDVPDRFNKYREINVRRQVTEFGEDHWQLFVYKALKPCHRMQIELRCEDGIKIRETNFFGVQDEFQVDEEDNKVRISYNHWLSPGYGVAVLIGLDGAHS